MKKLLVIFEDERVRAFCPLAYTRPVYMLRSGMTELWSGIKRAFPGHDVAFVCAPHLSSLVGRRTGGVVNSVGWGSYDRVVLFNGAVRPDKEFVEMISASDLETAFISNDVVGAMTLSGQSGVARDFGQIEGQSDKYLPFALTLRNQNTHAFRAYSHIWDLMFSIGENIRQDFHYAMSDMGAMRENNQVKNIAGSYVIDRENVFIHPEAEVHVNCVFDASAGPIYVDAGAYIEPNCFVIGPFYLGANSHLVGGRFAGSSIGAVCRVGGELEESIFHGYVNKHHAGFIGHSYVGEWVNFGAMTTNSDLKNNYSSVRVSQGGKLIDTGSLKVGSFIGDHTKFGIGALLNTGINIGVCCNIFGAGLVAEKEAPSFSWGQSGAFTNYDFEKAIETARRAMARRQCELSEDEITTLRIVRDLGR